MFYGHQEKQDKTVKLRCLMRKKQEVIGQRSIKFKTIKIQDTIDSFQFYRQ